MAAVSPAQAGRRSALLIACAGVAVVLAGCGTQPNGPRPHPLNVQAQEARQNAGHVPWGSAVIEADGRTLHLLANWNRIDHFVCDSPDEHLHLQQTSTAVTITVSGYARPLPSDVFCAGVGYPLTPMTVHLAEPLDGRPVVDGGFSARRPVLHDDSIPTTTRIPAGYRKQALMWDVDGPSDHTAVRVWQKIPGGKRLPVLLRLTVGVPRTFPTFVGSAGASAGIAVVDGVTARLFCYTNQGQVISTIRWTRPDGQQITFEAFGTTTDHLDRQQLLTLARTLQPTAVLPVIDH